ncbi:hypothetical protein [Paracoccus saliphilus]|uniref:Uncharacterized protein n=1 Tax=Paracoccus saliphilus TaxID=405559 RepID=A0AA45W539_9RHOB|nr:hypothetical protein [Paracoccus saliphilus]WCR02159.1 hypothetical protein JHX88_14775 [Paracoccus saliphilus]SIS90668.1 hypothetical protein SAMN05421772_10876 [Paracoccus saliphilus]
MGSPETDDIAALAALESIDSAAVPDITDTSYQAQFASLGEYAQTAFNEVLAQYRFLGLLAGIRGPNDTDQDVTDAREAVMEALAEFLQAGPLALQADERWDEVQAERDALQERIFEEYRSGNADWETWNNAEQLVNDIIPGHFANQSEIWLEQMGSSGAYYEGYSGRLASVPDEVRPQMQSLLNQASDLASIHDMLRAERRAAVVNFFNRIWQGVRDYYNENMELIRNGQWLLATGRIAIDAAVFAAEEIVVAGIVTAIIGITGGVAAGMALALRSAVRIMLSIVRQGTRVVRNVRATYVFRIELRKVEPGVLYSNPIPINVQIGRRIDYNKSIDVQRDLTPDEARAFGEGGQGSLEPDVDAPEQGNRGSGQSDEPARETEATGSPRSVDELLPNGRVPYNNRGFADWWDDLTLDELDSLIEAGHGETIENRIRAGRGVHEWLKTSQYREHKRLGFSMHEIQDWVTATNAAEGPLPVQAADGAMRWRHVSADQPNTSGSTMMHNALDEIYQPPPASRNDLLRRMGYFANHYLDGGVDALPSGLRDAILATGGG